MLLPAFQLKGRLLDDTTLGVSVMSAGRRAAGVDPSDPMVLLATLCPNAKLATVTDTVGVASMKKLVAKAISSTVEPASTAPVS
jgi:hypothetical protein